MVVSSLYFLFALCYCWCWCWFRAGSLFSLKPPLSKAMQEPRSAHKHTLTLPIHTFSHTFIRNVWWHRHTLARVPCERGRDIRMQQHHFACKRDEMLHPHKQSINFTIESLSVCKIRHVICMCIYNYGAGMSWTRERMKLLCDMWWCSTVRFSFPIFLCSRFQLFV